ncbi:WXG100 family type VII secretion target [Glycomyces rhizosphaerae]|uniref:WXG100 family type VII secretion target n=1 Tax=Glycomyces rhizosphaerae TaxID=2054422 RepID=A0ABV7PXN2_9ACTN
MSDYQGLDPADPALSAPAFGSPAAPPPPAGDVPIAPPPPAEVFVPVGRPACSNANCANPTEHPAEAGWQQLVSAVPVERQLFRLRPKASGMAFPTEADFRTAVAAVRPEQADAHSIERLRNAWTEDVSGRLADWSEQIKSNLNELAEGWSGTDFEAFEATCAQTRELVDDIIDDVDATVANLQATEEALYSIQGGTSGEIPYPAPQFWIDGDWHSWVSVHIRPAWWHGDCIEYTCQDAEHVLALSGAEPELATEIIDYIDERILHYIDYYASPVNIERDGLDPAKGLTVVEAKELAVADAMEHYGTLVDSSWGAYDARQAETNEDIEQRSADTDGEERSVRTVRSDKEYPASADPAYMSLESPAMEQPTGTAQPMASEDPSLEPPVSENPEPDKPADPAQEDDEDAPSGGLASGGSGMGDTGIGGSSFGAAPATTASASAPSMGSGMGAAATGAAAAGAAAAQGSRGSTSMMSGGGAGGGRGMGMDDKEREADVDLVEDENMWGFVNEDDDPYA